MAGAALTDLLTGTTVEVAGGEPGLARTAALDAHDAVVFLQVIGRLHLSGGAFEPIIPATVAALVELAPAVMLPGHGTGWKAQHAIARALPDAYVQTCVGTRIRVA